MTKKDYVQIARILSTFRNDIPMDTFADLVAHFSAFMKADNPRFDDVRFNEAACK